MVLKLKYIFSLANMILFLSACSADEQKFCLSDDRLVPCDHEQLRIIGGVNAILTQIKTFDWSKSSTSFYKNQAQSSDADVVFLGENHSDIIGQIENLGLLNSLANTGDFVLLEGADKREKVKLPCALSLVFRVFKNWEWEKRGEPYDPVKQFEFFKRERLGKKFIGTLNNYDLNGLMLNKLNCSFWDHQESLNQNVSFQTSLRRNQSMVSAIREKRDNSPNQKVFINAGYSHLPLGDYMGALKKNPNSDLQNKSFSQFYSLLSNPLNSGSDLQLKTSAGSSFVIYKYLMQNKISYVEYLHKRML